MSSTTGRARQRAHERHVLVSPSRIVPRDPCSTARKTRLTAHTNRKGGRWRFERPGGARDRDELVQGSRNTRSAKSVSTRPRPAHLRRHLQRGRESKE